MNNISAYLLSVMFLLLNISLFSQSRTCATETLQERLYKNHEYRQNFEFRTRFINSLSLNIQDTIKLATAFHFNNVSLTDSSRACLEEIVLHQLNSTNQDFQGIGFNSENWNQDRNNYSSEIGKSVIKFELANTNHPEEWGLEEGQPAITINKYRFNASTFDNDVNVPGYVHVLVYDLAANILGFSPISGLGDGDAVAVNTFAFGSPDGQFCGNVSLFDTYDKGRTLTHELGHYLGLDHIWGSQEGCLYDDNIADTPLQFGPNFDCFTEKVSCSTRDLCFSFMDYTDDNNMYMFTEGQVNRMQVHTVIFLQNVIKNYSNVVSQPQIPIPMDSLDSDSIKVDTINQDEGPSGEASTGNNSSDGFFKRIWKAISNFFSSIFNFL